MVVVVAVVAAGVVVLVMVLVGRVVQVVYVPLPNK